MLNKGISREIQMEQHRPQSNSQDNTPFNLSRLQKLQNQTSLIDGPSKQKHIRSTDHAVQKQEVHLSAQPTHDQPGTPKSHF